MLRPLSRCLLVGAVWLATASVARADIQAWGGHLSVGYARLFVPDAPGGSFSLGAGVDYPVTSDLRAGVDLGYQLLGSRIEEQGSLFANLDFRAFEVALLGHWIPRGLGPIGRVSFGPALFSARAELSTAGGGAAFAPLAVDDVVGGAMAAVTLIERSSDPVRVGLELGARWGWVPDQTWTVTTVHLAIHF